MAPGLATPTPKIFASVSISTKISSWLSLVPREIFHPVILFFTSWATARTLVIFMGLLLHSDSGYELASTLFFGPIATRLFYHKKVRSGTRVARRKQWGRSGACFARPKQ